jgi:hypothetical protein
MRRHLAYARYVFRHKWFVFLACLKLGVPIWLAFAHDLTKLTPCEWVPYACHFYAEDGSPIKRRDASGAYDPNAQPVTFKKAWLSHQRNKHHWHAWVSIGNGGSLDPLPMPERYVREMVADWIGAGLANGNSDPRGWYAKNGASMVLHPDTRVLVENLLSSMKGESR